MNYLKFEKYIHCNCIEHTNGGRSCLAHAEKVIVLIEEFGEWSYHLYLGERGLVAYPDLLKRLFKVRMLTPPAQTGVKYNLDDYECMVARCIEQSYTKSLDILMDDSVKAWMTQGCTPILRLLDGKYEINTELYAKAAEKGIVDPYYRKTALKYTLRSPQEMDKAMLSVSFTIACASEVCRTAV